MAVAVERIADRAGIACHAACWASVVLCSLRRVGDGPLVLADRASLDTQRLSADGYLVTTVEVYRSARGSVCHGVCHRHSHQCSSDPLCPGKGIRSHKSVLGAGVGLFDSEPLPLRDARFWGVAAVEKKK